MLNFLFAPWPKYVTRGDILINFFAYVPLGLLLALSLIGRLPAAAAGFAATAAGVLLSIAMEAFQTLVPGRIASNLDVLVNGLGSLGGAMAGQILRSSPGVLHHLRGLRERWLYPGKNVDLGLVLLVLWFFSQTNPSLPLMGARVFESALPTALPHGTHSFSLAETALSLGNMVIVGLLASSLLKPGYPVLGLCAALAYLCVLIKLVAATAMLKSQAFFQWLTLEAAIGVGYGFALLWLLLYLTRRQRLNAGLAVSAATLVLAYSGTDAARPSAVLQLFSWRYGHLLSFNGLTGLIAELWPLLALAYMAGLRRKER